jgi:hypothetical protein
MNIFINMLDSVIFLTHFIGKGTMSMEEYVQPMGEQDFQEAAAEQQRSGPHPVAFLEVRSC